MGWLIDCVTPILSVGKTHDREVPMIWDATTSANQAGERIEHSGWEVTFANIYSIRGGNVDDPAGTVRGRTSGWGIALHVKNAFGFSYDHATIPQAMFLGPVQRKSLMFYIDPIRALGLLRRPRAV